MSGPALIRDQRRALHAYQCVDEVKGDAEYRTLISGLPAVIQRSGLMAALAWLQRRNAAGARIAAHLARANVPGLHGADAASFYARVQRLGIDEYMLATRELLQVAGWLKRATQASFADSPEKKP